MWSSIVNIPVSFVAGMLFPLACEWISDLEVPVARVYATEACGFFIGGRIGHIDACSELEFRLDFPSLCDIRNSRLCSCEIRKKTARE